MSDSSTKQAGIGSGDVTQLLSAERLERLRQSFCEATMSAAATGVLIRDYPASAMFVEAVHDSLYGTGEDGKGPPLAALAAREREAALIVLLGAQRTDFELGIHLYWGMMHGLDPDECAGLLMLTGIYSGIGAQTTGLKVMRKILTRLDEIVAQAEEQPPQAGEDPLAVSNLLGELLKAFA